MELKIIDLSKTLSKKFSLNIKEMVFPSGEISSLEGDNGTGKTTLLKIIAGLDTDFKGKITYGGSGINPSFVTMVFQTPMLLDRSVYKNIEYPQKLRKINKDLIKSNTEEIIRLLGLEKLVKQNARKLSGGEAQKVALGRAFVAAPKLLLLDEPFSAIDANTITQLEDCILEYNKKNKTTIIIVSHNKAQISRICKNRLTLN